jgi:pimeloyl-ACP methyl ester carboxylesterase
MEHSAYTVDTLELKEKPVRYLSLNREAAMTVILIHGFPERGRIFERQIKDLSPNYHLIVPDLPCSGDSPYNPLLSRIEDFSAIIKSIMDTEKRKKAVIIGHSMGGYIALAFASRYPELVAGLGLLHSTAYSDSPEKKANRLKAIQTMEKYGGAAFLKSMIPALFGSNFKMHHPEIIQGLIQQGAQFDTRALQQYYQIMHDRTDKTELFKTLSIPYLFISGTQDQAAPKDDLLKQCSTADVALIAILDGAGHMGFMEQPDEVRQHLINFLSLIKTVQN